MDIGTESFAHLPSADIGNCVECQTIIQLVVVQQVLLDAVYDQMEKVVFLVEEQRDGEIANLFLRVLCRGDQVDGFQVSKVDVPPEDVDVEKLLYLATKRAGGGKSQLPYLTDILLLMVTI